MWHGVVGNCRNAKSGSCRGYVPQLNVYWTGKIMVMVWSVFIEKKINWNILVFGLWCPLLCSLILWTFLRERERESSFVEVMVWFTWKILDSYSVMMICACCFSLVWFLCKNPDPILIFSHHLYGWFIYSAMRHMDLNTFINRWKMTTTRIYFLGSYTVLNYRADLILIIAAFVLLAGCLQPLCYWPSVPSDIWSSWNS